MKNNRTPAFRNRSQNKLTNTTNNSTITIFLDGPQLGQKMNQFAAPEDDDSIEAMKRFAAVISRYSAFSNISFERKNVGKHLFLPVITPFPLQRRFCVVDNGVNVMLRASYFDLREAILSSHLAQNTKGLYITGPIGVGKSFLLYLFASQSRLCQDLYITYINDCFWWRSDPITYLVKELVFSFGCVPIDQLNVAQLGEGVLELFHRGQDSTGSLMAMIDSIYAFVCRSEKRWCVCIDQLNALYSVQSVAHEFPFNLIEVLNRKSKVTVVLSGSANNEAYPLGLKKYGTYVMKSIRYDDVEYGLWCEQNGYDQNNHFIEEAFFWSGGVPLELDAFHRTYGENLEMKLANFVAERIRYIAEIHTKFTDNLTRLSGVRMLNLMECVVRLSLEIEPPCQHVGMDKQLMCIMQDKICALNPLCHEVLLDCHAVHVQDPLNLVTSSVLSDEGRYTNDMKGRVLEQYLIHMTRLNMAYYFLADSSTGKDSRKTTFAGEISKVVRFKGMSLPAASSFSRLQTTLFVPFSSQYPRLNYFIWDSRAGKLFAVQVTFRGPMSKHKKPEADIISSWARFVQVKASDVLVLWVVPSESVTPRFRIQKYNYFVSLESLKTRYPALANVKLQQSAESEKSSPDA